MVELPDPHPVPGQVRVKVRAAGVNPVDIMVRNGSLAGLFAGTEPPFVPGMDIAGTIDEVGEDIPPTWRRPRSACGWRGGQLRQLRRLQPIRLSARGFGCAGSNWCDVSGCCIVPDERTDCPAMRWIHYACRRARRCWLRGLAGRSAPMPSRDDGLRMVSIASPQDEAFLRDAGTAEFIERGDDVVARVHRPFQPVSMRW
ncbi:alcohol dehydrogenase catalytic domain-containing protein [Burkholderia sp. Bp9143]|uniref:alcohol dehydrogenase catalytic domain-containing protein n=1 Tax=Burkholderia sp. Bp9143 TaxID=2184574 RepID=UPI003908BB05